VSDTANLFVLLMLTWTGDLWASALLGEADWKIERDREGFGLLRERPTLSVVKDEPLKGRLESSPTTRSRPSRCS